MAGNHPSPPPPTSPHLDSTTKVTDMDIDSLAHCASYLTLQDISNMAISCKFFKNAVSSDSIWRRLFRERWPQQEPYIMSQTSGVRESYLERYNAIRKFKFVDPLVCNVHVWTKTNELLFSKNSVFFSQGSHVRILKLDKVAEESFSLVILNGHNARVTSMRLFPLKETSLFRNDAQINENVLVTSSCDHSIRLWWQGNCQRCFRGHKGPVTILSDKLLGDGNGKVFASGGEDSTVRLWSLGSSGKHALKATLYGHEKPLVFMSVTGHNASLLASMSKDSKVRVWDTTVSSDRGSCCVGMTSVTGVPIGMKCHDSLLYMAAGSSFGAVDLRTMKTAFRTSTNQAKLYSFDIVPSKFLACTGGDGRAMLWDIRGNSTGTGDVNRMAELDGHVGPVSHLHMDLYKIMTAGPEDPYVNIWDADTGDETNRLSCSNLEGVGCCGMGADACAIVTAAYNEEDCVLTYRDYNNAVSSGSLTENVTGSKFWSHGHADDESDA